MVCEHCHKENRSIAKFCKWCGKPLISQNVLDKLVGLEDVKKQLKTVVDTYTYLHSRKDIMNVRLSVNAIIIGETGTGKTALSEIIRDYFYQHKIIEKPKLTMVGILKELQEKTYPQGSVEQKLSDLYKLAMDSARREKDGVAPVMGFIQKMEAAKTVAQLFAIQLEMMPYGDAEFFSAYMGADEKNAQQNILSINQGGLTLGQKDYYLETDEATTNIRENYKRHRG